MIDAPTCDPCLMPRAIPDFDDLLTLVQACLHNAEDMLADARLLIASGRAPRAHALAALAFEEIGKACVCILPLIPDTSEYFGLKSEGDFWKAWSNHEDKLAWARGFLSLLIRNPAPPVAEAISRLASTASADHLRKMRGLYVDYAAGIVLLPSDITLAEASALADDVQAVLEVAIQAWCHDQLRERAEVLRAFPPDLQEMMARARQAVAVDPDAALEITRNLLRSAVHPLEDEAGSDEGGET
jgi:AbiV family abortive infection protein